MLSAGALKLGRVGSDINVVSRSKQQTLTSLKLHNYDTTDQPTCLETDAAGNSYLDFQQASCVGYASSQRERH